MWFTDTTIAFVKERLANLENIKKERAELEQKLAYYDHILYQCNMAVANLSDEFRKIVYIGIEPDETTQKPVLLDEAIEILSKKDGVLCEQLEYNRKQEELTVELLDKLTNDYYPGILDEIKD